VDDDDDDDDDGNVEEGVEDTVPSSTLSPLLPSSSWVASPW
jgi:hypothetical protein